MDVKKPKAAHYPSSTTHRSVQKSTTLNRKFVKKPTVARVVKASEKTTVAAARRAALAAEMNRQHLLAIRKKTGAAPAKSTAVRVRQETARVAESAPRPHPAQQAVVTRQAAARTAPRQLTASELKDRAIKRALAQVENLEPGQTKIVEQQMTEVITPKKHFWRRRKFVIALSVSAISIAFLGFLVYRNLPDIISRVTAANSGIEAGEPAYLPKDFRRESIVSEKSGKVTISYAHAGGGAAFEITQEKSSWNSAALLSNYVKLEWGEDYAMANEQGLTIYVSGSNAAWVNGGIFYLIEATEGTLTAKELHDIAISI